MQMSKSPIISGYAKVTNLAKSKQYTAEHGTLVLQIFEKNILMTEKNLDYAL
jgi:hypothetical protein